jgi:hypothetical protein
MGDTPMRLGKPTERSCRGEKRGWLMPLWMLANGEGFNGKRSKVDRNEARGVAGFLDCSKLAPLARDGELAS